MSELPGSRLPCAKNHLLIVLLSFAIQSSVYAFDADEFYATAAKTGQKYQALTASDEMRRLDVEGRVSESNQRLRRLVPDQDKTFYDYFILGNMLFETDWQSSYEYMKRAEALEPDNPLLLLERGIHEHRAQNYLQATAYYERFHSSQTGKNHAVSWAYLTHTYLMTGQVNAALEAWGSAQFGRNHTAIEKGMYTIFANSQQQRDRQRLVAEINAGHSNKLCDLWRLDSNWEIDWWNKKAKDRYLEFDLQLAQQVIKRGSIDAEYFAFCSESADLSDAEYLAELKKLGILEGKRRLPESPALVYAIVQTLIANNLMSTTEFLSTFESQLLDFANRNPRDRQYFDVLAFLYADTENFELLRVVDMHGWRKLNIENFAASYIADLDPKSASYATLLDEALTDFPNSVTLNQFRLEDSAGSSETAVARFVAAQFANVKNNWSGPSRLNDYMLSLKHELAKL
jgi:hypothetical protein